MKMVIFGCGGQARSILSSLLDCQEYTEIILVDSNANENENIMGFTTCRDYEIKQEDAYIVAAGNNDIRRKLYEGLKRNNCGKCVSVTAVSACVGVEAQIGEGTFIAPYAYVGPQAKIGNNTIINTASVVEHETMIGDHTHIAPNAMLCGRCRIGNNVLCGAGSTVIDNISICDNVIIGAGAVVIRDIVEAGTYVGIPARKIH